MSKSGYWLENLVKEIEQKLLPDGFTVTSRKRVYNEAGNQIAEFDIEIAGHLGSSPIKWLIECRDRPSEGPAPASWIEQLVGRRARFKFNQITAVSTTGFAVGARDYANEERIDLRTVDELSYEKISEWFWFQNLDYFNHFGDLKHAEIRIDKSAIAEEIKYASDLIVSNGTNMPIFNHTRTGQAYSIANAWQAILNQNPQLFDDLRPNIDKCTIMIDVDYSNPDERLQIICKGKPIDITQMRFVAELSIVHQKIPIAQITEYKRFSDDQSIAQTVRFELITPDRNLDMAFHRYSADNSTTISIRAKDESS